MESKDNSDLPLFTEENAKAIKSFNAKKYYAKKKNERQEKYQLDPSSKQFHFEKWDTPAYKVLKQIHPSKNINYEGKCLINHLINATKDALIETAIAIQHEEGDMLLTANHVNRAAKRVLVGELAAHAISESTRACTKFYMNVEKKA